MSANSLFFSPKRKRLSSFDPTQTGPTSEKESDDGIMRNVEYQTDDEKEDESVFYHRHRIRNSPSENNTTVMGHGSSFRSPAKFPSKISEPGSLVKSAILKGSFADGETWLTTNCSYSHEESEDMDENYSRLLSSSCQEQDSRQRLCLTKEKHSLNWLTEDINSFTRSCDLYNDDDKDDNSVTGLRKQFGTPILSHSRLADELRDSPHSPEPRSFSLTDFGTPVAKVGSPSVLDGLDCPISMEEDSVMDLSTERNEHPVSAVDSVQTESFLKLAEPRSPSGVQHVSDLSALVPQLHHNNTRKKRCSGTLLPLPDLAAFDTSKAKFELEKDSPVCPPTPLRTPFSSIFTVAEPEFSIPLLRQNSLEDNKLLLSQSESPRGGEIIFLRDFIIEGIIGTGAFAEVYKVRPRNASTLQSFAVKKIKRQFRSRKDRDWLLNEVKMMKKVGLNACRNIVPFVRAWQEDSYFYVQLGLAEKGSLKDFLLALISKRELVPDLTLWHVFLDCICGLSHIHQCGIVHLDIKPANLLIDSEGRVLIGDFGMASEIGSKEDGHEGDTRYMAPELLDYTERLPSADIFSLGLTLFEMLFTREQLQSGNIFLAAEGEEWHKLRDGSLEFPKTRNTYLMLLIRQALSPQPLLRPTAFQLHEDLLQIEEFKSNFGIKDPVLSSVSPIVLKSTGYTIINYLPPLQVDSQNVESTAFHSASLFDRAITPH